MSWMDEWYKSLALHNTSKCDNSCRHCKYEKEAQERCNMAIEKAKVLLNELKDTDTARVMNSWTEI